MIPEKLAQIVVSMNSDRERIRHFIRCIAGSRFTFIFVILCAVWLLSPICDASADTTRNFIHHRIEAKIIVSRKLELW